MADFGTIIALIKTLGPKAAAALTSSSAFKKTVSGSAVSFDDGADFPISSLKVNIEAAQDLHGYDNPWVGGAGKNKFKPTAETTTVNDVTFTVNSDGSIKTTGTASAAISNFVFGTVTLPAGTYKANGFSAGASNSDRLVFYNATDSTAIATIYNNRDIEFTLSEESTVRVYPIIKSGQGNNLMFYPMIRLATETDATFAPYSNICPITGFDAGHVIVSPTEDPEEGTTYNIAWNDEAGIVYGGEVDVTKGKLKVTHKCLNVGNEEIVWSRVGSTVHAFRGTISDMKQSDTYHSVDIRCSDYTYNSVGRQSSQSSLLAVLAEGCYGTVNGQSFIYVRDDAYTDATSFKNDKSSVQIVYELATPIEYNIDPITISTLEGTNNVWADTGDIEVTYQTNEGPPANNLKAVILALADDDDK